MPFIRTSLNITLSASQEEALKKRFGEAIACIPGKSENWLMLEFSDNCRMWFKGEQAPMAMVDVSIFGGASPEAYEALTAKLLCRAWLRTAFISSIPSTATGAGTAGTSEEKESAPNRGRRL